MSARWAAFDRYSMTIAALAVAVHVGTVLLLPLVPVLLTVLLVA